MSHQSQVIQYIPLNKLVASPRNVRRKHPRADIESLAASIHARGLLQNLCVVPGDGDCFEVEAGGRRRLALKLLAKEKRLAKDWPVPCHVVAREDGVEVSLTENVHRVGMDAMDEVDAYAALVAEDKTPDEVARRFGVERRHVDQRLALAGLSPKIKAAWKRGNVSLEAARAFCLVDDHAQQDAVYRSLGKPVTHPSAVRARLMDGRVRVTDRLVAFVGLEAYEAAGGTLLRDLFEEEAVFVESPALLAKLAEDKLTAAIADWAAQGWSWVEINLATGRGEGLSSARLQPDWRDPTDEEQAELNRLSAEIEALDAELDVNAEDDDSRWSARDDLEAAYETIRQAGRFWPDDKKQIGGVMLSIGHDGSLVVSEGLVRVDDQKRLNAWLKQQRGAADGPEHAEGQGAGPVHHTSPLPKAVNRDLTLERTRAIRLLLSGNPDIALALCVSAMVQRNLRHVEIPGIAIGAQVRNVDDLQAFEEARAEVEGRLPEDDAALLDWALDLSRENLLAVLAVLVAGTVDLAHEDASPHDARKQVLADRLAQHLDLDMRKFWTPDLAFWTRLPKAALLAAYAESPGMADRGVRTREDLLKAHAKLKKDDLAASVAGAFEGAGYLPDILVTPAGAGTLSITPEGIAAISMPAVAAE
jgi:ParB family chromosome partitioning protein